MKKVLTIISLPVLVVLIIFFYSATYIGNSAIDIHFHDTYFVIAHWYFLILYFFMLTFLFSLIACFVSKFRKKTYKWILLISSLEILTFFAYVYLLAQ